MQEIRKIRLNSDWNFRLTVNGDTATLIMTHPPQDMQSSTFPVSHPAYAEALRQITPDLLTDTESSCQIAFVSGETAFADPDRMWVILNGLLADLSEDSDNVDVKSTFAPPTLMGLVAYQPSVPGLQDFADSAPSFAVSVLHPDGSWECKCGVRGLTGRFCPNCGSEKPTAWRCQCGADNEGRFCRECGSPRP